MNVKKKLGKKKLVFIAIVLLIATFAGLVFWIQSNEEGYYRSTDKAGKKYLKDSFHDGSDLWYCSKKIEVVYKSGSPETPETVVVYSPVNQEEFVKYCRTKTVLEYRAVIDILKRKDVSSTIAKYDTTKAWVKALGHTYINDKDYLKRILPAYSSMKIDCVIVVHSPEGTRFFIENGEKHESHDDHRYIEVQAEEFLASLNKAPDADVTNFWLGLH